MPLKRNFSVNFDLHIFGCFMQDHTVHIHCINVNLLNMKKDKIIGLITFVLITIHIFLDNSAFKTTVIILKWGHFSCHSDSENSDTIMPCKFFSI